MDLISVIRNKEKDQKCLMQLVSENVTLDNTYIYSDLIYHKASRFVNQILTKHVLRGLYLEDIQAKYQSKLRELGYYSNTLINISKLYKNIIDWFGRKI